MSPIKADGPLVRRLAELSVGNVTSGVDLGRLTRWRIGGMADAMVEPDSVEHVAALLAFLSNEGVPYCVVGETSNLLFDSSGLRGVLVRVGDRLSGIEVSGSRMSVASGTRVPHVARTSAAHGLAGIEHIVGIPGTMGGLVLMNGGSQRKGIGSHVASVQYVSETGEVLSYTREQCDFSYRHSSLQGRRGVVVGVELELEHGDSVSINQEMDEIVESRAQRFPQDEPNCGSTFLSNPAMYATVGPPGKVIEEAGFKGMVLGGAQVSPIHANFINNASSATSDDVLSLIGLIRGTVHARTGFLLDAEARYVAPDGSMRPAHEVCDDRGLTREIRESDRNRLSDVV
ncbi:UDP-N-acetylmuramate dehydrogenase [Microbacterium sp. JZ37]|uniref:UDP-N-acetylmuramate dehydrogenase n=1 Tax=Microbacterium sp. JZ37 TaxID=2654193 RepID=UPI002B476BBD|nr:UDP-N-acetylmuramate dehydrogenase [Microbacterium sp. JZ37]WRH19091.1 UDP-N-acetylmuramate dehydrogenase [Microbacterium sp. JZ37]